MDVAILAELLRETAQHHDHYEKTHAEHNWWDWYAEGAGGAESGSLGRVHDYGNLQAVVSSRSSCREN